jgi:hypothetical protein
MIVVEFIGNHGGLFSVSRDQGQWWFGVTSVKPHRAALLTDRTAPSRGLTGPTPAMETHSQSRIGGWASIEPILYLYVCTA